MIDHFINKCKHGTTVSQCRCPSREKTETIVACPPECTVTINCLNCGWPHKYDIASNEANGVFNVFCDGECEDIYAARL